MELIREKFRESKSDFKGSTKRNFQIFKIWKPQFWSFISKKLRI